MSDLSAACMAFMCLLIYYFFNINIAFSDADAAVDATAAAADVAV